jgi:hypothetical protein
MREIKMIQKRVFPSFLVKIWESFKSVIPIAVVVLILYFTGKDNAFSWASDKSSFGFPKELLFFLLFSLVVALGLGLFSIGVDQSLERIGKTVGSSLTKKQSIVFMVGITFIIGFLITFAEPDLKILAQEVGMNEWVLITVISVGVGLFLVLGTLRIIFQWDMRVAFLAAYATIFILANIAPKAFLAIAFDSGGVTTGPVTIPFILAFGSGIAATRQGSKSGSDEFGLVAHATMGPIIAVIILAICISISNPDFVLSYQNETVDIGLSFSSYGSSLLSSLKETSLAIGPLALFFIVYDLFILKLSKKDIIHVFFGLFLCYLGLIFFMSAVNTGFKPIALSIGKALGNQNEFPLAIVIGALFGCFAVLAEPAVMVLTDRIVQVSEGSIKKGSFLFTMAISIALAVMLSVIRVFYGFSLLYYIVPGYLLVFLLSFFVPRIYSSMAFDAGTVASGPMAASFTMPFILGLASSLYSDKANYSDLIYENAFGVIAMISLLPIIVVEATGLYATIKTNIIYSKARKQITMPDDDQIIHFTESNTI